jgi:prephenate dehydratase
MTMPNPQIIVYKGPTSQTGLATKEEFPGVAFRGNKESFEEIAGMIEKSAILAILPMWNSHEGEITKAKVLGLLFENKAKLYRAWPKMIPYECICKSNNKRGKTPKVISVHVAKTQCSKFLKKISADFIPADSTVDAYEKFHRSDDIDMVLCAPGQNKYGHKVLCTHAENPMNFTSFAFLGCLESKTWSHRQWGILHNLLLDQATGEYFGVQMPISTLITYEDQEELLSALAADRGTLDEVPKVLFVTKRSPSECGLLIESGFNTLPSHILTEGGYSSEVKVILDVGVTNSRYPDRINSFIKRNSLTAKKCDFIRHIGTNTCFFACPVLGVVTHGFEAAIVEPVVRRVIVKLFELIDSGISCSKIQQVFFKKYKKTYYDKGIEFIKFMDIDS